MDESEVYYYAKKYLRRAGVNLFGGEPPGGSDDLHRIELKHPDQQDLGSRGSRKFDLIGTFDGRILLIELKDFARKLGGDIAKLNESIASPDWVGQLWDNMNQRGLVNRYAWGIGRQQMVEERQTLFVPILGASSEAYTPPPNFIFIGVDERGLRWEVNPEGVPDVYAKLRPQS